MPQCWGWSPGHGAYVGCRERTSVEGHCAGCRARCGYELETSTCSNLRNVAGSAYQAIAPMTAELLLGVGGRPPGDFGALLTSSHGVRKDAQKDHADAESDPDKTLRAVVGRCGGMLSHDEVQQVSQLATAAAQTLGLCGPLDCTPGSVRHAKTAAQSEPISAIGDHPGREYTGTKVHTAGSRSSDQPHLESETHPWLAATGIGRRREEIGDVVAQFNWCSHQPQKKGTPTRVIRSGGSAGAGAGSAGAGSGDDAEEKGGLAIRSRDSCTSLASFAWVLEASAAG